MLAFFQNNYALLTRYTLTGSTGFGIDILAFTILVSTMGFHYLTATVLGYVVGSTVHFLLTRQFVFSGGQRRTGMSYVYFLVIGLAGVTSISVLMYLAVDLLKTPPVLSRILIGCSVGCAAYLLHKHISFGYATVKKI